MALSDRDIIITPNRGSATEPNILFRGADVLNSGTITLTVLNTGSTGILRWEGSAGNLVSITNTNSTVLNVLGTAQSTSTLTGALQVAGGVGIQGNLWVGGTINGTIAGAGSATTATNLAGGTANQIPVQTAPNTTGFIVAPSVANTVLTWNGSAFIYALPASTFNGGTITNPLFINNATPTGSTSTGAFVVLGGVGIGGDIVIGGSSTVTNNELILGTTNASSTSTGALQVRGGAAVGLDLRVGGSSFINGSETITGNLAVNGGSITSSAATFNLLNSGVTTLNLAGAGTAITVGATTGYTAIRNQTTVTNTTNASSTNTGALVVTGGVGIGGNLNVGGTLIVNGTPITPIASLFIEITATAAQTIFTIPGGYTPPYIQVFANGILLSTANYTAINGTTVTVNNARNAGDIMRFIAGASVLGFTTSTFATNILGGAANQLVVQTGTNATGFITAPVSANTVLTWNGSAFTWAVAASGGGTATGSAGVNTVSSATNATRFLTFVDNNYGSATTSSVYTDAGISYNPSTNDLTITGGLSSGLAVNLATSGTGDVGLFGAASSRAIVNAGAGNIHVRSETGDFSVRATTSALGGLTVAAAGGVVTINTNSNASSAVTGALRVTGGAGISLDLYVGGTIYQNGFAISTGSGITAIGSTGVSTRTSATNATRYLTFVDNDYGSATTSSVYTDAGISYNPSTNDLTITGTFIQTPATLGSTLGNTSFYQSLRGSNGNSNLLEIFMIRDSAGADWTTAGTRIQQKIDATWMAYEQFNGVNNNGGIEWGSGLTTTSPQTISPRLRLTSAGLFYVLTTTQATSTNSGAFQVVGGAGIGGNLYVGGTIYQNGVPVGSGGAGGAGGVTTVSSATNATRYLTFVDNNYGSATTSSVYTDAGISYNPSTNDLTISNVLNSGGAANLATGSSGDVVLMGAASNRVVVNAGGGTNHIRSEAGDFSLRAASSSAGGLTVAAANGSVIINPNTNATSTGTGALIVNGGIGANGNIYTSGNLFLENASANITLGNSTLASGLKTVVLNRNTVGDTAVINAGSQSLFAGNTNLDILNNGIGSNFDLRSYSSAGAGPTGQAVRIRIEGSQGDVQIFNDTQATSTSTGALQVRGGLAVGGNIHFGGQLFQNGVLFTGGGGSSDPVIYSDISSKFDGLESVFILRDGTNSLGFTETFSVGPDWTAVTLPANGGGGAPPPSTTLLGTTVGAGSLVIPANVTGMTLEAWGAGGGSAGLNRRGTDTAAGGAFAQSVVNVTAGQTVFYSIGAGGTGGSTVGGAGTESWINVGTNAAPVSSTVGVRAAGGAGSGVAFPNNSTQLANSVGSIVNIGGAGAAQIDDGLGGGGGGPAPLYVFTNATFTTGGATGQTGPSLVQARAGLTGTGVDAWKNDTSFFNTNAGQQYWTVPEDGIYRIEARGASGRAGTRAAGKGAVMAGNFVLIKGEIIYILVGQQGDAFGQAGGGGGGSFVTKTPYNTNASILVIAGGGGGSPGACCGTQLAATDASTGTGGNQGLQPGGVQINPGGTNGNGGGSQISSASGGGGGFFSNGANSSENASIGGQAYVSGGLGRALGGGFGGGGGIVSDQSGGGGGGYSGGGNSNGGSNWGGGGGGGSFNNGTVQANSIFGSDGNGQVVITKV